MVKFKRLWNKVQKAMKCCMLVCTLMLIWTVEKLAERILTRPTGESHNKSDNEPI